jgi:hypothetical protein
MKRGILFFIVLFCSGLVANAQNLQRGMYNDGKILAYIEQRNDIYRNNVNQRADRLQLENLSGQEITVHYCYKSVGLDANGKIFTDKMQYRTETFKLGEKKSESGYMSARGYYVDSFAVMNVSVKFGSTPQNSTGTQPRMSQPSQGLTVPLWAQGTWGRSGGTRITSTQFIQPENELVLNCIRSSSGSVDFEGTVFLRNNPVFVRIVVQKTNITDKLKVDLFFDFDGTTHSTTEYSERYREN